MKKTLLPVLATAKAALTPFRKTVGAFRAALGDDGDTITIVRPDTKQQDDVAAPWHVVVFNDPVNLMSYVSMVIQRIFGYPASKATLMMLDVHQKGSCIVWTGEKERAEHYVQQLQSHQLLCQMRKATD
jgi:ATP-dependent Clp protease adaptor protein ClpS